MIDLRKFLIVFGIIIMIIAVFIFYNIFNEDTYPVNSNLTLSNKKYGWGIKRANNHKQPELKEYLNILNKYDGIALGSNEKPYVYLTFDAGYESGYTEKLLEVLEKNQVNATFFITGHYLNTASDLVERMISEGHIVGNHTVNHYSMPDIDDAKIKKEVMDLHIAVFDKFNYEMKYIRPPKGEFSERTLQVTNNLGYKTVMWSFAYDDWDENAQKGEEYAKEKILKNVHNGAIILLHSNSKDNCNVLDYCIKEIKNMGYEFKSIDDFVI